MATINLSTIDFSGVSSGPSAKLQEKTATILLTDTTTEILPDTGYDGMSKVSVSHNPVQETVEQTITSNGSHTITPSEGYGGMIQCVVDVNVPEKKIGSGSGTYTSNGQYVIRASDKNLDGYSLYNLSVSVPDNSKSFRIPNQWNGSVDSEGLKALGWTDEQISGYQSLCTWMDYENSEHLVPDYDKNIVVKSSYQGDTELQYAKYIDFTAQGMNPESGMFKNCTNLKTFPAYDLSIFPSSNYMFENCSSLEVIPALTVPTLAQGMFSACTSLTIAPKHNITGSKDVRYFYSGCMNLKYVPELDFSQTIGLTGFYRSTGIEEIGNIIADKCTSASNLFFGCANLRKVGRIHLADTANNNQIFGGCTKLEYVAGFSYRGTYKNGKIFTAEMPNLTHFIMEDYINCTWDTGFLTYCPNLDYDSIKSILTACSKTTLTDTPKSITFNSTVQDQNGELQALVDDCVNNKNWTVAGLQITTTV